MDGQISYEKYTKGRIRELWNGVHDIGQTHIQKFRLAATACTSFHTSTSVQDDLMVKPKEKAVNVGRQAKECDYKEACSCSTAQEQVKRLVSSVFQSVTTNSGRMQLGLMDPLVTRATKSTDQEQ